MLPPKPFDNFPPDWADAQNHRGLDASRFFFGKHAREGWNHFSCLVNAVHGVCVREIKC